MIRIYLIPRIYWTPANYLLIGCLINVIKTLFYKGFSTYISNSISPSRTHWVPRNYCGLIINVSWGEPGGEKI